MIPDFYALQGVLWNPQNRTFGMPDILVRSDWLNQITEEDTIEKHQETIRAPALDGDYHYRVVDNILRFCQPVVPLIIFRLLAGPRPVRPPRLVPCRRAAFLLTVVAGCLVAAWRC